MLFCIDLPNSTSSAPASEFVLQDESFLWSATSTNLAELAYVMCVEIVLTKILNIEGQMKKINKEKTTNKIMKRANGDNELSKNDRKSSGGTLRQKFNLIDI